jgi:hypothetical protein
MTLLPFHENFEAAEERAPVIEWHRTGGFFFGVITPLCADGFDAGGAPGNRPGVPRLSDDFGLDLDETDQGRLSALNASR